MNIDPSCVRVISTRTDHVSIAIISVSSSKRGDSTTSSIAEQKESCTSCVQKMIGKTFCCILSSWLFIFHCQGLYRAISILNQLFSDR